MNNQYMLLLDHLSRHNYKKISFASALINCGMLIVLKSSNNWPDYECGRLIHTTLPRVE